MTHLEPGSFEAGGVYFSLSESVLRQRKPYTGKQWPASGAAPAALATPAPKPLHITPASTPAPSAPAASLATDQPDYCALSFQQSLWRTPSGEPWQGTGNGQKPARPGLSLRALEELRR